MIRCRPTRRPAPNHAKKPEVNPNREDLTGKGQTLMGPWRGAPVGDEIACPLGRLPFVIDLKGSHRTEESWLR